MHRERWGELGDYLRKGWPIFVFLRQHWDAVAYMRGWREEGSSDQFSPAAITAIIQDDYFFTYWDLQLKLRDAIQGLLRWVEGCACHASVLGGGGVLGISSRDVCRRRSVAQVRFHVSALSWVVELQKWWPGS